jgi:hypothetical protein
MKETIAPSWQDFEKILGPIEDLRQKARERQYVSELLYRGQADFRWRLETTLERTVSKPVSLEEYYRLTKQAKPRIETFADKSWKIPTYIQYSKWLRSEPYPPPSTFMYAPFSST